MGAPEVKLSERVKREFDTLPEPFFAVVHLSNVHYPFLVDEKGPQPFQPASRSKAPEDNARFFNQYQNAVHQQDWHVRDFLEHLQRLPAGPRTVVLYTSDHGEAFREHGNMGHSSSVLEEEIHVPGWLFAPPGTITAEERSTIESKRQQPLTHSDYSQTMLDLLGIHDAPEIQQYLSITNGRSLLRPGLDAAPVPLTNCAGVWSCAFENWGALQGWKKLEAREWDTHWRCFDLQTDPNEQRDLGEQNCPELIAFAGTQFGRLPGRVKK